MTGARRFSLNSPDWGQAHLTLDAIVAYVDDELSPVAHARAQAHLECCGECRAEVVAQRQARAALRGAGGPSLPSSLLHSLRSIPVEAELPPMPPGLGVTAEGQFVLLRDVGTDGIGFTGIAVALLARLSPLGVILSAIFFGLLTTTFRALERSPLDVHSATAQAVQGALVIAVLVITSTRWGRTRASVSTAEG